jgi:uncharacterized membrane protein YczE
MRKNIFYLICSVLGNALGTALMANTNLGLTAWGSAALNVAGFFDITFGTAFIMLALIFYMIALVIRKKIEMISTLMSVAFLLAFGLLSDLFINIIPNMTGLALALRILINFIGLSILLFSIALHLKIYIAVHPCDVFLYEMQVICKHDALGTYLTYGIAIMIAIIFGLLNDKITGIGIGTLITISFSGAMIRFFNKKVLNNI